MLREAVHRVRWPSATFPVARGILPGGRPPDAGFARETRVAYAHQPDKQMHGAFQVPSLCPQYSGGG
jgi:hypothetical protein